MNDIAKQAAAERLITAMAKEKMGPSEAARKMNILPQYVTMAKDPKYYHKMPAKAWDRILQWINSGESLERFKIPIGEEIVQEKKHIRVSIANSNLPTYEDPPRIPKKSIEVIPPATECIEELDAVKIKIIIDLQIYVNGKEIEL